MSKLPNYLARAELQRSDWRIMRAVERQLASSEWCEWRDELRRLVAIDEGFDAIPSEPPFGKQADLQLAAPVKPDLRNEELAALRARVAELETPSQPPQAEPETHFADLMLADETIDDARERLSQRLRELRHYLIAPEIKPNEDGSVGLTSAEQSELQDLERRQTLGRWLEA